MDIAKEIQKLYDLKQAGAISEEDYQKAKESLLSIPHTPQPPHPQTNNPLDLGAITPNTWSMFIHLSQLLNIVPLAGVITPILLWQLKKDESDYIDQNGRAAVNWMITAFILLFVGILLIFIGIGIPLLAILGILNIIFPIIAAIKANNGEVWHYPMSIQFLYNPDNSSSNFTHDTPPNNAPPNDDDHPTDRINSQYD